MKKGKKIMIDDLPVEMIHHIMSFMGTKSVFQKVVIVKMQNYTILKFRQQIFRVDLSSRV